MYINNKQVLVILKIREAIIVEGIYDKIKLKQMLDATIITTDGFGIFTDTAKLALIQKLAEEIGIVVLTDSDTAGFLIRNYIKECISPQFIKHAYIPEIKGVEKRKTHSGKEGLLGVEGVNEHLIFEALQKAGCIINGSPQKQEREITKLDLYRDGFYGKPNSSQLRHSLKTILNLPSKVSTNSLLDILNTLYGYDEYKKLLQKCRNSL